MRLLFAGTPEAALPALDALLASRHEVAAVLTRPDAPAGRGRPLAPSPVRRRAEEHGLEVLTPRRPSEPAFLQRLQELRPDACPVVAYGAMVPPAALAVPAHGWVNLHFSLLPAWRGAAPVQWAILAGDEVTGASTFRLEEGLDTGPVYGVMTERVQPRDTAGDLLSRLAAGGAALLRDTLDGIADGTLTPVPQPTDGVSLAPKLTPADARVAWERPAVAVDRQVRGCTPAPGAWSTFRGERIGIGPVLLDEDAGAPRLRPGEVAVGRREVHVGTLTGPVRLGLVRPRGRREMPAPDWARGARLCPGEVLGDG